MIPSKDELMHYASKYYDPDKAHEYYMRTRELKGRKKTTAEENTEKFNENASTESSSSSSSGSFEEEYERYSFQISKKISDLQRRLGRMSKEAKLLMQDEIYAEIDKLKEEQMNKKYELKAKYGKGSGSSSGGNVGPSEDWIAKNKAKYVK